MAFVSRESITLYSSSSSGLRRSLRQPAASLAVSSRRGSAALPKSVGWKVHSRSDRPLASVSSKSFRPSVRVSCANQEVAVEIPPVTDATWESLVLKADGPVLVEFWASWCGPCRMIDPVIGKLANKYAGKLKFFKLNTDDSPSIAAQYGIKSIPTTMLFVDGEKKDLVLGAVPETTLVASIEKFL